MGGSLGTMSHAFQIHWGQKGHTCVHVCAWVLTRVHPVCGGDTCVCFLRRSKCMLHMCVQVHACLCVLTPAAVPMRACGIHLSMSARLTVRDTAVRPVQWPP